MSKANYDLPDNKILAVMKLSGAKTKREALINAMDAFLVHQKRIQLIKSYGKFSLKWTKKALESYRD